MQTLKLHKYCKENITVLSGRGQAVPRYYVKLQRRSQRPSLAARSFIEAFAFVFVLSR